ncbi:hypothetical protein EG329_008852 [Mollisiaceae sp. DMI_Dod_QoI]|nr:hypothetical protein EG329_008852 [Helotiales sp. DMI_Dod_QoI]
MTNIDTTAYLKTFIEKAKEQNDVHRQYIVIIQDVSPDVIDILEQELGIPSSISDKHIQGRVNNCPSKPRSKALHSERLTTTLLGRSSKALDETIRSITWWRLLSQNRESQKHEAEAMVESGADLSRFVTPIFPYEVKGVSTKGSSEKESKKWYQYFGRAIKASTGGFNPLKKAGIQEESIFKLDCHTYRPHQIITEVADSTWGSACEERVSFCDVKVRSANFCIVLLDKERSLKQYRREIEIVHSNISRIELAWNSESSKGIARIVKETPEASEHAFMTSMSNGILGNVQYRQADSQAAAEEDFNLSLTDGNSTRARLLRSLLDKPPKSTSGEGTQTLLDLCSRIIDIIAEDWNYVLSQMSQTLDAVDSRISDDHELHENVPSWRRLLCSWRVNIIEYSARLSDVRHHLEFQGQISRRTSPIRSVERSKYLTTSNQSAQDEETPEVLRRYEILGNAVEILQRRTESSFHALMASMSIAESEKAISQGTAIGRLTELAFIFVPLNFACAFFSMQITNFNEPHQPNIGSFFGLGIGLIALVYALRAGLRSSFLAKLRNGLEKQVRKTKGYSPSSQIPTRVVLRYGWEEIHPYIRVFLITVIPFVGVFILVVQYSSHKAMKILVGFVLGLGIFPVIGNFLAGKARGALRSTGVVAWLILILSATVEQKDQLNVIIGAVPCIIYTTIFVVFLAYVPGTFDKPLERSVQLILPQWLMGLPIAGVSYAYEHAKPHWEPWMLNISLQAPIIVYGICISFWKVAFYHGIPELASLIGITIGIPTSIIWQYLPTHGNPIPQYYVIALTFGCSIIYCIFLWIIPYLRHLRCKSELHTAVQFISIFASIPGLQCALAWAYYPTQGRLYTDINNEFGSQPLSMFYGAPIPLWVQISITFGAPP